MKINELIEELEKLHTRVSTEKDFVCSHCYTYYQPTWPCETIYIVEKYKEDS